MERAEEENKEIKGLKVSGAANLKKGKKKKIEDTVKEWDLKEDKNMELKKKKQAKTVTIKKSEIENKQPVLIEDSFGDEDLINSKGKNQESKPIIGKKKIPVKAVSIPIRNDSAVNLLQSSNREQENPKAKISEPHSENEDKEPKSSSPLKKLLEIEDKLKPKDSVKSIMEPEPEQNDVKAIDNNNEEGIIRSSLNLRPIGGHKNTINGEHTEDWDFHIIKQSVNRHDIRFYPPIEIRKKLAKKTQDRLYELGPPRLPNGTRLQTMDYNATTQSDDNVQTTEGQFQYTDERYQYKGEQNAKYMKNGAGVLISDCGGIYEGEFKNDTIHGFGRLVNSEGEVYIGNWFNYNKQGQGQYTSANGKTYTGNWKDDKENGAGIVTYTDGSSFKGNFVNGVIEGVGTEFESNGEIRYKGTYKHGKYDGYGEFFSKFNESYKGYYRDGKYHGKGFIKWPDGESYKGNFSDGQRHGYGEYFWENVDKNSKYRIYYKGEWNFGNRQGFGVFTNGKDEYYKGSFQNNKYHGQGFRKVGKHDRYEGRFANGVFIEGKGTETTRFDNRMYTGKFERAKRHGDGTENYLNEGRRFKVTYKNGQCIKRDELYGWKWVFCCICCCKKKEKPRNYSEGMKVVSQSDLGQYIYDKIK